MDKEQAIDIVGRHIDHCKKYGDKFSTFTLEACEGILALLEDRETESELEGGGSSWWHVCGECRGLISTTDNYCRHCGRRLKHS